MTRFTTRKVHYAGVELEVSVAAPRGRLSWWIHNLVAHPLLVLWPRLGEWLHGLTEPAGDPRG
jgi:hypothetical protein